MALRRTRPSEVPTTAARPSRLPPPIRLLRPKQWSKNVLVFAAPFAAGVLLDPRVLFRTIVAFVAFCLAASGTYCVNDASDHLTDRQHPVNRHRPVAAGHVSPALAFGLGGTLLVAALALSLAVNWQTLVVIGCYVALTTAYSLWLKEVAVVDLAAVAGGFILRSVAGGAAAPVAISQWFLIVAGFGSLFIVAGKRHAEHLDLGEDAGEIRSTLAEYSIGYLRFVRSVAAAVAMAAYCLWAFERAASGAARMWYELSIIPFVVGVLYYALRLEQGAGAAPEDIVLSDRTLQAIGVAWVVLVGLGVHAG